MLTLLVPAYLTQEQFYKYYPSIIYQEHSATRYKYCKQTPQYKHRCCFGHILVCITLSAYKIQSQTRMPSLKLTNDKLTYFKICL